MLTSFPSKRRKRNSHTHCEKDDFIPTKHRPLHSNSSRRHEGLNQIIWFVSVWSVQQWGEPYYIRNTGILPNRPSTTGTSQILLCCRLGSITGNWCCTQQNKNTFNYFHFRPLMHHQVALCRFLLLLVPFGRLPPTRVYQQR